MAGTAEQFDLVIGNPPYQETANSGNSIWPGFVKMGLDALRDGGRMAMIHPPAWRATGASNNADIEEVRELLGSADVMWISMTSKRDCGRVFPGISTPFDCYVVRKSSTPGSVTEIEGTDGKTFRACIKGMDFVPNIQCFDLGAIIAKDGEERVDFIFSSAKFEARRDWMSRERKGKFVHPCVWSVSRNEDLRGENGGKLKFRWSSTTDPKLKNPTRAHFGVPKVIFGEWHESGIPHVDSKGEYGLTQHAAAIADDPAVLPFIARAMDGFRFRNVMAAVRTRTRDWDMNVIKMLRRDFWKEFVNGDGDWIDEDGRVMDRGGIPLDQRLPLP